MIDVTLKIGEYNASPLLSTYTVTHETEYPTLVTTMDGTEYGVARYRPVITFSMIPLTDAQSEELYNALSRVSKVTFTDPHDDNEKTGVMRLTTNTDAIFGIRSIDGNRYYKGSQITLRQRAVI